MGQIQVEVGEGPVLQAEGAQGGAVNLRGQVLEQQPGGGGGGRPRPRPRPGLADGAEVGVAGGGGGAAVAPAAAVAAGPGGEGAGGGLLLAGLGPGHAPQVLPHLGQRVGAGAGGQPPGVLHAGLLGVGGGEAPGGGAQGRGVVRGGGGARAHRLLRGGGLADDAAGGHAARGQGRVLGGVLGQRGPLPRLARHELGDAEVVLVGGVAGVDRPLRGVRPAGVAAAVGPGPVVKQQVGGAGRVLGAWGS